MNKGMDKRDTLFVIMKTLCKDSFFVFSSIRKNESKENYL